jgi:hypothetical protein
VARREVQDNAEVADQAQVVASGSAVDESGKAPVQVHIQDIVGAASEKYPVSLSPDQKIVGRSTPKDDVGPVSAFKSVPTRTARKLVGTRRAVCLIVSRSAGQAIVPDATADDVVATSPTNDIPPGHRRG